MDAAADINAGILADLANLGVPWWGWIALLVMIFFGVLVPSSLENEPEELARGLK